MSKKCPECGERVPNLAHYCGNCGYDFFDKNESKQPISTNVGSMLPDGKLLFVLIAIVIIVAAGVVLSVTLGGNQQASEDNQHEVDLTITEVNGYSSSSASPMSYSLYTDAIFNKVPSNLKGYNIKTTYYDENDTVIGEEIETLSNVYYDTDYSITFGYYTTYKKPNPDHVTVEIIKEGKTIDSFTSKIDQGKIKFLN
ncbi:hypothetical protein [Methanobrevibacter sp.]|uniref:hypothetical protein n=1 Tax=Methanobrevibacter sp. TaxID=66852 RepID=UPI0025F7D990|nr:hypothetical protein [Methanobrevibacter sp.]MBQ2666357.1 hypothetical protein [Methanobrevibacter sp.]MBQ2666950.1 hypothetical protein [Methanobrevibacter sp.]